MTDNDASKIATNIRMDSDVIAAIDRRAKEVGLSRTQWIEKCCRWSLHNLPFRADGPTRTKAAMSAPREVAGTYSEDMGLDGIEQK